MCNGAEKAIFIRGIPEMHIKNINLENMTLQAKIGVDIQEASGINIKNVNFISKENNPLLYVLDSDAIVFDKVQYKSADLLLQVEGDRSGSVKVLNTDASKAKKKMEVGFESVSKWPFNSVFLFVIRHRIRKDRASNSQV